nr:hypothetical protein [Candidatus Nardonella dryophthoridicola]
MDLNEAVIKIIGVGGGGNNSIEYISKENILGINLFAINTDYQVLKNYL